MNTTRSVLAASLLLAASFGAEQGALAQTAGCNVAYSVVSQWNNGFQGDVKITNQAAAVSGWTLIWTFPSGQTVTQLWSGMETRSGASVTVNTASFNAALGTGATADVGFTAA